MSGIDKARWDVLSSLLDELLDLDTAARTARLEEIRRTDSALVDDLLAFLRYQGPMGQSGFLEDSALQEVSEPTLAGQVIGSYTLGRPLGQGGMGTVWLAQRSDGRFEAQVAIKLLNLALVGLQGLDRFRREGNLLARLAHPNIARLLDAGITHAGQPYLVLEYVEGEPIDQWCSTHAVDVASCIRLFLEVLDAVSHAHSNLILHRDLKPSNILVTADRHVKLLDFGLAKLLDDQRHAAPITDFSQLAGRAFTPEYAAPEQVQGGQVTMATDVYSLGVLLYVLLTGRHPTSTEEQTPIDRLRSVVDSDPARPSELIIRSGSTPTLRQRAGALRGDLDNIVLKALKKSAIERYGTVAALTEDLRRYLNHEPVSARADSVSYRMTRFVARNKLAVSAFAVVLMAIVVAALVSIWQAREATRQRDRVLALSARNEAVVDFIGRMLMEVAPTDQAIRVPDLLKLSLSELMSDESDPEHQAAILSLLSEYYRSSGQPAEAQTLLSRALDLTRASSDKGLRATLLCNSALAALFLGRISDATTQINAGLELSKADPTAELRCLRRRAELAVNSNDGQGALEYAMQARARLKDGAGVKPHEEAQVLIDIAAAHHVSGHPREADRFYAQAMARLVESGRGESHLAFITYNNWAAALLGAGDVRGALLYSDEALRIATQRSINGELPANVLSYRASILAALARYSEALAVLDLAIASATRTGYERGRIGSIVARAYIYTVMGEWSRAEQELAVVSQSEKTTPPDTLPAITMKLVQARIAVARGRLAEATDGFSAVIDFFDGRQLSVAPLALALVWRAETRLRLGNTSAAMTDAQRAERIVRSLQGDNPYSSFTGKTLAMLARVHQSRNEPARARILAIEAVQHLSVTLGEDHPATGQARQVVADLSAAAHVVPANPTP